MYRLGVSQKRSFLKFNFKLNKSLMEEWRRAVKNDRTAFRRPKSPPAGQALETDDRRDGPVVNASRADVHSHVDAALSRAGGHEFDSRSQPGMPE